MGNHIKQKILDSIKSNNVVNFSSLPVHWMTLEKFVFCIEFLINQNNHRENDESLNAEHRLNKILFEFDSQFSFEYITEQISPWRSMLEIRYPSTFKKKIKQNRKMKFYFSRNIKDNKGELFFSRVYMSHYHPIKEFPWQLVKKMSLPSNEDIQRERLRKIQSIAKKFHPNVWKKLQSDIAIDPSCCLDYFLSTIDVKSNFLKDSTGSRANNDIKGEKYLKEIEEAFEQKKEYISPMFYSGYRYFRRSWAEIHIDKESADEVKAYWFVQDSAIDELTNYVLINPYMAAFSNKDNFGVKPRIDKDYYNCKF